MIKVCASCKQELPIDLFRLIVLKGVEKHRQAKCKPCMQAYQKTYYESNKEHIKKQIKDWRKNNPNYLTKWRENNPEKLKKCREKRKEKAKEYQRKRYLENPEAARLASKKYREENFELVKVSKNKWRSENRDHIRSYYKTKTENLSDAYIRNKLSKCSKRKNIMSSQDIPQSLVEIKRLQILIQREIKNEKRRSTTGTTIGSV
jgi:hypothetical protein